MDEMQAAQIKRMDDAISKIYHSKDGGRTAYKLWLDAKAVDPARNYFRLDEGG